MALEGRREERGRREKGAGHAERVVVCAHRVARYVNRLRAKASQLKRGFRAATSARVRCQKTAISSG